MSSCCGKLPNLSAWPGISLFLCTGCSQRGVWQPSCAVQESLNIWLQPHSTAQGKGVCLWDLQSAVCDTCRCPLETCSDPCCFGHILVYLLPNWELHFTHTLAFLAVHENSSSREFLPRYAQDHASCHSLWSPLPAINHGVWALCQGWKADELPF